MQFRPYQASDKDALLAILESNCPRYFVPEDKADLIDFLDNYADANYLVAVEQGNVIGCGGHYTKASEHGVAWVMFERGSIGRSRLIPVATRFWQEIEGRIRAEGQFFDIVIHTTQLMTGFFGRFGFETVSVVKDGFGPGLDECRMRKQLSRS